MKQKPLKELLKDAGELRPKIDWEKLLNAVSEVFNVPASKLRSKNRHREVALGRQVGMTIAYEAGLTCREIGDYFNKNHSTIFYARETVYNLAANGTPRERSQIKAVLDRFSKEDIRAQIK